MGRKRVIPPNANSDDSSEEGSPKRSRLSENKENVASNQNAAQKALQTMQNALRSVKMNNFEERIDGNHKSGKIKKIYLKNFMCHSNFEVNLNNSINVIVGLNGSGKSAILTAIAIGLGSKAAATARSTNLKDLVRRGEPSASIEITITNDGVVSYEHDVYGDEITIVRTINGNSGASTYKIKTKHGKVISTSRQDLVKLCLCLNIQVENPVLILNQDAARSFLKECDPKKLYQLFIRATQLETIIEKLNLSSQIAQSSKTHILNLEKAIPRYENDISEIREKYTRLQSVRMLRKKIEDTKNEIEWLKVIEVEKLLATSNESLAVKRIEIRKISDLINNKEKYDKQNREKIRELGTSYQQLTFEYENLNVTYENARKEHLNQRNKLSELENNHKGYSDRLAKNVLPNIRQLQQEITEHENNPANAENLRIENQHKIQDIERKMSENSALVANAKRDFQMFMQALNQEKENLEEAKGQLKREQEKIVRVDAQITQYKNSGKDTLSVYGPSASRLIKELDVLYKKNKFTQLPRAFLGRYIKVIDKKYRQVAEIILQNELTAFIVNCDKDRLLLVEVLKKYSDIKRPRIITTEFVHKVYDTNRGRVHLQNTGVTLMDVIRVQDPVVMNCLVDNCKIERIALVEDADTAIRLTQNEQTVPKNLHRVVLLNPLSDYYPAPSYRSYSIREQPLRYIQTNFNDLINDLEKQKRIMETKFNELRDGRSKVEAKISEYDKHVAQKKKIIYDLNSKEKNFHKELEELRSVEFPENIDIEFLRMQLVEEEQRKQQFEMKIEESRKKLVDQMKVVEDFKTAECRQLDLSKQSLEKIRIVQTEVEELQRNINNMKHDIETKGRQIKSLQDEQVEMEMKIRDLEKEINNMTKSIKGNRVKSNRSEFELHKIIKMNEKRIEGIESSNENIEDIEVELKTKTEQLKVAKDLHDALDKVYKELTSLREKRYIYIRKLRQHMTIRMKHKFHQLMELRNYSAEIDIDHKDQKLQLKVIPRDSEIEGAVSNTKALSGGERSYSTVAFLLSLWSCVDHPFYFLDEYDVFSDEYNRHIMTQLLLNEADKKRDKQFGFLTPQEFSNIQASENLTIHKLQDPERMD